MVDLASGSFSVIQHFPDAGIAGDFRAGPDVLKIGSSTFVAVCNWWSVFV